MDFWLGFWLGVILTLAVVTLALIAIDMKDDT